MGYGSLHPILHLPYCGSGRIQVLYIPVSKGRNKMGRSDHVELDLGTITVFVNGTGRTGDKRERESVCVGGGGGGA